MAKKKTAPPSIGKIPVKVINRFGDEVRVPEWVMDLESFRRWTDSDAFPEEGRIDYLQGEVWIDMSKEQLFSHNQCKTEFTVNLGMLVKAGKLGRYFMDGVRLTNIVADLPVVPEGTFIAMQTMREAEIKLVEGAKGGYTEVEGVPDLLLEIVSDSSVKKGLRWRTQEGRLAEVAGNRQVVPPEPRRGRVRQSGIQRGSALASADCGLVVNQARTPALAKYRPALAMNNSMTPSRYSLRLSDLFPLID